MTKRTSFHLPASRLGTTLGATAAACGLVYLFAQLSTQWQIALGAVLLLAAYVLFNGYRAHVAADRLDHTTD